MERTRRIAAREHGGAVAVARRVRAATLRLSLALAIAGGTAALSLAALSARTEGVAAMPADAARPLASAAPARPAAPASTTGTGGGPAVAALRTDI